MVVLVSGFAGASHIAIGARGPQSLRQHKCVTALSAGVYWRTLHLCCSCEVARLFPGS